MDVWRSLGRPLVASFCASCKHSLEDYAATLPEDEGREWKQKCQGLSALLTNPRVRATGHAPAVVAYHQPWDALGAADALWGDTPPFADPVDAALAMRAPIAEWLDEGARIHQISRHMLGLFHARPGARLWRRTLSQGASKARTPAEGLALYDAALDQVRNAMEAAA